MPDDAFEIEIPDVGPRRAIQPVYVPPVDPERPAAKRWIAASGFETFEGPPAPSGPAEATERALRTAAAWTSEALASAKPGDEALPDRAAHLHTLAADLRRESGAWAACTENYHALTRHHLARREMRMAMASMNRLVAVSSHSKTAADRIDADILASQVYCAFDDFAAASAAMTRAAVLAVRQADLKGLERISAAVGAIHDATVSFSAREGEAAACKCGSALRYEACCKKADRPPAEFLSRAVGVKSSTMRPASSPWLSVARDGLDVFMERPLTSGETPYWVSHVIENGRNVLVTLPNWTGRAMTAARAMQQYSLDHPDGFEGPTSTVLQVHCALEAFINGALYFISDEDEGQWEGRLIEQRLDKTKRKNAGALALRWEQVGEGVLGKDWVARNRLDDLSLFASLRAALVHYKEDNIEQIFPEPDIAHEFIAAFKDHRDFQVPGAMHPGVGPWVDRLLTPHLAGWAVALGEELIASFRNAWHEAGERYDREVGYDPGDADDGPDAGWDEMRSA
ncbi:hypothetical protein [Methylobacterium sp. Leaf113]|uniref:hypothetical protein n=1 Tax=Methylobacterium sp. Leaf113 TaxID=1736259 RepID=UPI0012E90C18|nr:hypothetical protein [Methylobacterium sp. Leaf113]